MLSCGEALTFMLENNLPELRESCGSVAAQRTVWAPLAAVLVRNQSSGLAIMLPEMLLSTPMCRLILVAQTPGYTLRSRKDHILRCNAAKMLTPFTVMFSSAHNFDK